MLLGGCRNGESDPYVWELGDRSYGGRRGNPYAPTADGGELALEEFAGKFVWVEYAAPWCGPCVRQAPIIKRLEGPLRDEVAFVTVITSAQAGLGGPTATRKTAQQWAKRFRLAPERVAASDLWSFTVPQHILYSPEGQTLYRKASFHPASQAREVISRCMRAWKQGNRP